MIEPGAPVTWLSQPRGGYGYVVPVPAVVERLSAKRVLIRVRTAGGEVVLRWVKPEALKEEATA